MLYAKSLVGLGYLADLTNSLVLVGFRLLTQQERADFVFFCLEGFGLSARLLFLKNFCPCDSVGAVPTLQLCSLAGSCGF